jgi:Na+-driven multidrug efflux pump
MAVALFPGMWLGLFSNDEHVVRIGTSYLQITGPLYGFYGLGGALFFVTQGVGSNTWTMIANAVRLLVSSAGALIAIYWLDLGQEGFFVAIAGGFCAYAALATAATLRVKEPATKQP